jgi:hypothetical protein
MVNSSYERTMNSGYERTMNREYERTDERSNDRTNKRSEFINGICNYFSSLLFIITIHRSFDHPKFQLLIHHAV